MTTPVRASAIAGEPVQLLVAAVEPSPQFDQSALTEAVQHAALPPVVVRPAGTVTLNLGGDRRAVPAYEIVSGELAWWAAKLAGHTWITAVVVDRAARRICRRCGCSDDARCVGGCRWVETAGPGALCSACMEGVPG